MEKEVIGNEEEVGGAGRLVIRSLCCLTGMGSNSLISKLYLMHECGTRRIRKTPLSFLNFVTSLVFSPLHQQRIGWEIFWNIKRLQEYNLELPGKSTVRNSWNSTDDLDSLVLYSADKSWNNVSRQYESGNKLIDIKPKLVFGPHENVRHSVRKRAVSKEELHFQFTWRWYRYEVLVWWDRRCGEVARSSSSVCNKVTNEAAPEPSGMPSESRDGLRGRHRQR